MTTSPGELINYGNNKYNPLQFETIKNDWVKPLGGLWTSPINSEWGWKAWCKNNSFRECDEENSFIILLSEDVRIFIIDTIDDLIKCPKSRSQNGWAANRYIDFEEMAIDYDAIWLTYKGEYNTRHSNPYNLYGWDVESVLILNRSVIRECSMSLSF